MNTTARLQELNARLDNAVEFARGDYAVPAITREMMKDGLLSPEQIAMGFYRMSPSIRIGASPNAIATPSNGLRAGARMHLADIIKQSRGWKTSSLVDGNPVPASLRNYRRFLKAVEIHNWPKSNRVGPFGTQIGK